MQQRSIDSQKVLTYALVYNQRVKNFQERQGGKRQYSNYDSSPNSESTNRKIEQCLQLLCMLMNLNSSTETVDDMIKAEIAEKISNDKLIRLQRGELPAFEELFLSASPKFYVAREKIDFESHTVEPSKTMQQLRIEQFQNFSRVIHIFNQRQEISAYLKLFSTIPIAKLAHYLNKNDDVDSVINQLTVVKMSERQLRWTSGCPSNGEWINSSDCDFVIENDLVRVLQSPEDQQQAANIKKWGTYGDYFQRQAVRLAEIRQAAKMLGKA